MFEVIKVGIVLKMCLVLAKFEARFSNKSVLIIKKCIQDVFISKAECTHVGSVRIRFWEFLTLVTTN